MLYYVPNVDGGWSDPNNIQSVVIDEMPGQPFEAHGVDINADGKINIENFR